MSLVICLDFSGFCRVTILMRFVRALRDVCLVGLDRILDSVTVI
jgi:hypothetical protein